MNTITIQTKRHPRPENAGAPIYITPEANRVVQRLRQETGRSMRSLVSEILLKADSLIEVVPYDPAAAPTPDP